MSLIPTFPSLKLGNPQAKELVVFLGGFPDDETSSWGDVLEGMSEHRIFALCLPGLGKDGESGMKKWGWTFEELISGLKATIDWLRREDKREGQKFTLVGHDWGSFLCLLYENKYGNVDLIRLACFDVGITSARPLSPRKILHLSIIVAYQSWFSFCYIISQLPFLLPLAEFLLRLPFILPIFSTVGPCPYDKPRRPFNQISVTFCYMYMQFWLTLVFRNKSTVTPRFPTKPLLYIYGNKKNVLFHSQKFLTRIDHAGMSKWVAVEDAGHWIMHSHPQLCIAELQAFMKR